MTQLLTKKILKNGFLKVLCLITQKNDFKLPENLKTENDPWCLQPQFSQLPLGQLLKVGTVLKSLEPSDLKTELTF